MKEINSHESKSHETKSHETHYMKINYKKIPVGLNETLKNHKQKQSHKNNHTPQLHHKKLL